MVKVVWMSDPHFQKQGTINGLNPRVRLEAALAHANQHYGDATFAIMSGDLVGDDIEGDYSAIARHFEGSDLRIYPMVGNNDDRAAFLAQLSIPKDAQTGFAQYTIDMPGGLLVCLDTHKIGSAAGSYCAERFEWLRDVLAGAKDTNAYIFMHHPPMALGLPKQDEIMLDEAGAFLDLIADAGNVKHLFMGHVHRTTCGTVRGIPFTSIGSLAFQAPAPRPEWDWSSFKAPEEAPHYAVIDFAKGDVTVQFIQFCDYELGIEGG